MLDVIVTNVAFHNESIPSGAADRADKLSEYMHFNFQDSTEEEPLIPAEDGALEPINYSYTAIARSNSGAHRKLVSGI